ncbi:uncharacterized protein F4812DRAFT_413586 [Daldinia caldariorum]|uniref:uncharacterized protein n=1 Tax=Daldinia caldariorum TaxID=326644 RepID=UPI0020074550|nr:uncharacterized protein F4812DRAFT_413586 [Daldinia caldariorum]KAI1471326.1 hypothetical protein F4812DRAFT_413586 [Daldinia caldariorum]
MSTSTRSDFSAIVSDDGSTSHALHPSYCLDAYLLSPPTSATERIVANQTKAIRAARAEMKAALRSWEYDFDKLQDSGVIEQGERASKVHIRSSTQK